MAGSIFPVSYMPYTILTIFASIVKPKIQIIWILGHVTAAERSASRSLCGYGAKGYIQDKHMRP